MNRLCYDIEAWHKQYKWKRHNADFDYTIMLDQSIPTNEDILEELRALYLQFNKESDAMVKEYRQALTRVSNRKTGDKTDYEYVDSINWQAFHNSYRNRCFNICPDICELANYVVKICYEIYPKRSKKFMWIVGGEGILVNLKQTEEYLPMRNPNGEYEYLGNKYSLEKIQFD